MKFLPLSFILFLLIGCECKPFDPDKLSSYTRKIENRSSYDIWIINPTTNNCDSSIFDSLLIPSFSAYDLEVFLNEGASHNCNILMRDYEDCPSICIDSLNSRIDGHDSLELNIPLHATSPAWSYWEGGNTPRGGIITFSSGECICDLTIVDDDIN